MNLNDERPRGEQGRPGHDQFDGSQSSTHSGESQAQSELTPDVAHGLAVINEAHRLRARGHHPILLYGVRADGSCTCSKGRDCGRSAGKHPVRAGWERREPSWDEQDDRAAASGGNNLGLRTGGSDRLVVIDADGDAGIATRDALRCELGALPETLCACTGSDGLHEVFRVPAGSLTPANSESKLGSKIDVRGKGGQIVVHPSRHRSGKTYEWFDPHVAIAELPAAWVDRMHAGKVIPLRVIEGDAYRPGTRVLDDALLMRLAKKLQSSKRLMAADLGTRLERAVKGEAFADDGEKDGIAFQLCSRLVREFPDLNPATTAGRFAQSLDAMIIRGDLMPPVDQHVGRIREKLERLQREHEAEERGETVAGPPLAGAIAGLPESLASEVAELRVPHRFEYHGPRLVHMADGEPCTVAPFPIWIRSELSCDGSESLVEIAAWEDGRVKTAIVSRALLHDRSLPAALEGRDVRVVAAEDARRALPLYLSDFSVLNRDAIMRRTAQAHTGWSSDRRTFMLGESCIGGDVALYAGANPGADGLTRAVGRTSGTAEGWRGASERLIAEAPIAGLVLAASVASAMLAPFGWAPIGLMLAGLGGGGKSTLLRLAGSVWGDTGGPELRQPGGVVGSAGSTLFALLGQFRPLHDLPHLADELRIDRKNVETIEGILHQLSDGHERLRMNRSGRGLVGADHSPGCVILATETDPGEFLRRQGAKRRTLVARTPFAPEAETAQWGRFCEAFARNFGHAGRALVMALVEAREIWPELSGVRERHLTELKVAGGPSEIVRTWAGQVATALAAVEVACALCPDFFPSEETCAKQIRAWWVAAIAGMVDAGGLTNDTAREAYECAIGFFTQNQSHFWRKGGFNRVQGAILGRAYPDCDAQSERLTKIAFLREPLVECLQTHGYSLDTIARVWIERGWLVAGKERPRMIRTRIDEMRDWAYHVVLPDGAEES
jgi:hypothetical protein